MSLGGIMMDTIKYRKMCTHCNETGTYGANDIVNSKIKCSYCDQNFDFNANLSQINSGEFHLQHPTGLKEIIYNDSSGFKFTFFGIRYFTNGLIWQGVFSLGLWISWLILIFNIQYVTLFGEEIFLLFGNPETFGAIVLMVVFWLIIINAIDFYLSSNMYKWKAKNLLENGYILVDNGDDNRLAEFCQFSGSNVDVLKQHRQNTKTVVEEEKTNTEEPEAKLAENESDLDKLKTLKELLDMEAITQSEYDEKKKIIMSTI
jgi:hypothetical protein